MDYLCLLKEILRFDEGTWGKGGEGQSEAALGLLKHNDPVESQGMEDRI